MNPKLAALKNKITGKVGAVLAAPKMAYFGIKKANADTDTNVLKTARAYKNAPDFEPDKGPTDAFKYRSAANDIKSKRSK